MSEHHARISWLSGHGKFDYDSYCRDHVWEFEQAGSVNASATERFLGDPSRVNPEEAYVAALASCHMLTFLAIAARKRVVVCRYVDRAVGYLERGEDGKLAVTRVLLRPRVEFDQAQAPTLQTLKDLHCRAHSECFLANSVRSSITIEPSY